MKVKIKIGEQTHEVEHSEIQLPQGAQIIEPGKAPEGYVTTEFMNQEIRRRGDGLVKPDSLLEDADFWKKIAQKRGVQLGEDGKPITAKEVDVEELHKQWKREYDREQDAILNPLKEENGTLKTENNRLKRNTKLSAILRASEAVGVKKQFRTTPGEGTPSAVEAMFEGTFGFDEDGKLAVIESRDEQGNPRFKYSANPSKEKRHADPEEFFKGLAQQDAFKDWFEDNRPTGGNLGGTGGSTVGIIRISEADSRDPRKWAAAEKQATETGAKIEVA